MSRKAAILKLRQVLLKRREALRKALAGDLSLLKELRSRPGGDAIDAALDSAHNEINSQLVELESRELAQIEKALQRMEDGTYGICEVTGKPIPLARLQALPYATLCVEAQRELEKTGETAGMLSNWGGVPDDNPEDRTMMLNDLDVT